MTQEKPKKYIYDVHITLREKYLVDWINEKITKGEFQPTFIFRDAIVQLKQQDDILNSENPLILHKQIATLKLVIKNVSEFVDEKKLEEELLEWREKNPIEDSEPKNEIEGAEN